MIWQIRSRLRRFWLVVVRRQSPELADLYDFFDNPKAPWNHRARAEGGTA